jgi:hypothetical protein
LLDKQITYLLNSIWRLVNDEGLVSNASNARIGVIAISIIAIAGLAHTTDMQTVLGQQQTPFDALAMRVNLKSDPVMGKEGWYDVFTWAMRVSNGSSLCPSGGCVFSLEGPPYFFLSPGGYSFTGTLKVSVMNSGVVNSRFYQMVASLNKVGSKEMLGQRTEALQGTIGFGTQGPMAPSDFTYNVVNGTLQVDPYAGAPVLTLQAVKQ